MSRHSIPTVSSRPEKPPFKHARGWWAKKYRGRTIYFQRIVDDPDGSKSLAQWLVEKQILEAGYASDIQGAREHLASPNDGESLWGTVDYVCQEFLEFQERQLQAGEIRQRTFDEYAATCKRLVRVLGRSRKVDSIKPPEFAKLRDDICATWGLHRQATEIQRIRTVFTFALTNELIDRGVKYGSYLEKPSKKAFRQLAKLKPRDMQPAELRAMIEAASPQLALMILMGLNLGYRNQDIVELPISAIDRSTGWVVFARPKTDVERRAKLWPITRRIVEQVMLDRPTPKDCRDAGLLFITRWGQRWSTHAVSHEFRKLAKRLGIYRPGVSFASLPKNAKTRVEEAGDFIASEFLLGHVIDSQIDGKYRTRVSDQRIEDAVRHIETWLFGTTGQEVPR